MSRFGETPGKVWQAAKQQAGGILTGGALFLLAFLAGVHLFFPTASVQRWLTSEIDRRTPLSLQIEKLSVFPVFALVGRQATVSFDSRALPPILLDDLRLKPLWTSLVSADPGLSLQGSLLQGRLAADIRRSGDLNLHLAGLQLKDFPVSQDTQALLSGTIAKGELRGSFPVKRNKENQLSLEMDNASLTLLGQPLALGRISVQGSGQGNNLRLTTLSASGGDMNITGNGNLLIGVSAATSRINLDLTLRPASSATPTLLDLLELAGQRQPGNTYALKLSGSLSQLTIDRPAPPRGADNAPREEDE